jgi:hypothetical protein
MLALTHKFVDQLDLLLFFLLVPLFLEVLELLQEQCKSFVFGLDFLLQGCNHYLQFLFGRCLFDIA